MEVTGVNRSYYPTESFSKDAFKVTPYEEDYIFRGKCFFFSRRFTIASGSTLYFLSDYSTYTNLQKGEIGTIVIKPAGYFATKVPLLINFYTGSDYEGTEFHASNTSPTKYASIKPESGMTFHHTCTGTTLGTAVPNLQYTIGGDSPGITGGGGNEGGISLFEATNQSSPLLMAVVNQSGADSIFTWKQVVYEI